jgi:hypothetical protein
MVQLLDGTNTRKLGTARIFSGSDNVKCVCAIHKSLKDDIQSHATHVTQSVRSLQDGRECSLFFDARGVWDYVDGVMDRWWTLAALYTEDPVRCINRRDEVSFCEFAFGVVLAEQRPPHGDVAEVSAAHSGGKTSPPAPCVASVASAGVSTSTFCKRRQLQRVSGSAAGSIGHWPIDQFRGSCPIGGSGWCELRLLFVCSTLGVSGPSRCGVAVHCRGTSVRVALESCGTQVVVRSCDALSPCHVTREGELRTCVAVADVLRARSVVATV